MWLIKGIFIPLSCIIFFSSYEKQPPKTTRRSDELEQDWNSRDSDIFESYNNEENKEYDTLEDKQEFDTLDKPSTPEELREYLNQKNQPNSQSNDSFISSNSEEQWKKIIYDYQDLVNDQSF